MMLTQHHRTRQEQEQRSSEALHTVLSPHVEGEDVLPTGPLPPLPERPPPKDMKGKSPAGSRTQQANSEARPSASRARDRELSATAGPEERIQRNNRARGRAALLVEASVPNRTPQAEQTDSQPRLPQVSDAPDVPIATQTQTRGRRRLITSANRGSGGRSGRGRTALSPSSTPTNA